MILLVFFLCELSRCRIEIQRLGAMCRPSQRGRDRVIVLMRNGVVLMFVTSDTPHGQPEHRSADGHHHVVELVVTDSLDSLCGDLTGIGASHKKPRGGSPFNGIGLQQVTCQLHLYELVEWKIRIQGANHPVSIVVRSRPESVELVPPTLGEPGSVEPVSSPFFAVAR